LAVAAEVKPDSIDAPLLTGKLRRLQERYDEAKTLLERVLTQDPEHREARLLTGLVLLEQDVLSEAANYFDLIIKELRDSPEELGVADQRMLAGALNGRGRVDLANKQMRLALSRFNQARTVLPDLAETYYNIGEA